MKKILHSAALLLFSTVLARADVVLEQKMESAMINGNMTIKVKGDRARMDVPSPAGQTTVLMDLKSGDTTTLLHSQKMMVKMNMGDARKAAEAQSKATGVDITKLKPVSTGVKEKVGDWNCEVFEMSIGKGTASKIWIAKDYPNYKALREQLEKINAATAASMGMDPGSFDLGGMTVKTEVNMAQGKITTTLISAKEEPVADSEFEAPTDYKELKMPGAPAAK